MILKLLSNKNFYLITVFRILFFCLCASFAESIINLHSPLALIYIGIILAAFSGNLLGFLPVKPIALYSLILTLFLLAKLIPIIIFTLPLNIETQSKVVLAFDYLSPAFLTFLALILLSFNFCRSKFGIIPEIILVICGLISCLSLHRNYRLDLIKEINELAWNIGVSPLITISSIGFLSFIIISLYFSSQILKDPLQNQSSLKVERLKSRNILTVFLLVIIGGIISFANLSLYKYHARESSTKLTNGVGENSKEGLSPLNFEQSLGKSNQPMALAKLNSEYKINPDTPMLYLRESALSQLSGNYLVLASTLFDTDVQRTSPNIQYNISSIPSYTVDRQEISLEAFLIAKHKLSFAIDFPTKIAPLIIPANSNRFNAAFKSTSLAPNFNRQDLLDYSVGDPNWDTSTLSHYTKKHQDLRYTELAKKIIGNESNKIKQVNKVVTFLNKNAIYTLTPNHKADKKLDQTAEFLFGDMRGYCVHFSHATVFLLRALDIPARIGTGYLANLSQARDGHILLRSSDRHAWAEVFVTGIGWVNFDATPEQVESHANTPIDAELLDSLISEVGDTLNNLPELTDENDNSNTNNNFKLKANFKLLFYYLKTFIICLLFVLLALKSYLRFSYYLTLSKNKKIVRYYRAVSSILLDIGARRNYSETREAFKDKVAKQLGLNLEIITQENDKILYSTNNITTFADLKNRTKEELKKLSLKQKLVSIINPSSCLNFIFKNRW